MNKSRAVTVLMLTREQIALRLNFRIIEFRVQLFDDSDVIGYTEYHVGDTPIATFQERLVVMMGHNGILEANVVPFTLLIEHVVRAVKKILARGTAGVTIQQHFPEKSKIKNPYTWYF